MTRIALRFFNLPGLVLLTLFGVAIQTSLFSFWPLTYLQPDLILFVVIWVALKRGFFEGGCITLIIADIAELHSAAPQGMFLISYMAVFLAVRGLSRLVVIPNLSSLVMVTLFVSIFWKTLSLGVLHLLGASGNQWRHTLMFLFPGAVVEGVLGLWIYRWLERYDLATFKSLRTEHSDQDEELQIFEGGGA